jgi:excinuclease ABC subunit A
MFLSVQENKSAAGSGLGYITLGQSAVTLSGGEAQRVNWARNCRNLGYWQTFDRLMNRPRLHFEDVSHLLDVLNKLVDRGIRCW